MPTPDCNEANVMIDGRIQIATRDIFWDSQELDMSKKHDKDTFDRIYYIDVYL